MNIVQMCESCGGSKLHANVTVESLIFRVSIKSLLEYSTIITLTNFVVHIIVN